MTPEEQRIAIAEACEWKFVQGDEPTYGGTYKNTLWKKPDGSWVQGYWACKHVGLPDYLNDLNAMHEAINHLSYEQQRQFLYCLGDALGTPNRNDWQLTDMVNADAAQRAEAFLRTIGKWKD